MDKSTHFGIDRYRRMKERNAGYSRALVRTNLAVQCWIARAGEDWRSESGSPLRRCMLTWLLANHIVQAFYSRTGIDIQPFSCGGMYGYGMSVGIQAESCNRRDIGESAWIACGSVRVDTKVGEEREFCLTDAIIAGEEPLWVVDKGAMLAIGSKWPDRCRALNCQHRLDSEVYLTIYQIITMLLAMGYVEDAILGTFVDCSDYGDYPGDPKHPLRLAGVLLEPQFTQDYFEIRQVCGEKQIEFWIHRRTGSLLFAGDRHVQPFSKWCGGKVEQGLSWICSRLDELRLEK